jgi:DNA-binding MarR family transcriptional regulator
VPGSPADDDLAAAEPAALATELRMAVAHIVRRFRQDRTLSGPQTQALIWLERQGPKTTSQLAALELVRPQSMAQTVALAEEAGLVSRRPDPDDGRQSLIEITDQGRDALDEFRRVGERWLSEALEARLSAEERAELAHAVGLIHRLVD